MQIIYSGTMPFVVMFLQIVWLSHLPKSWTCQCFLVTLIRVTTKMGRIAGVSQLAVVSEFEASVF